MTSRMATTAKVLIVSVLLNKTKLNFQRKIKELQAGHEIPECLIVNFDQTPLPKVCIEKRTYHTQGPSNFSLIRKRKNKQIIGPFKITTSREFLPMQLIY